VAAAVVRTVAALVAALIAFVLGWAAIVGSWHPRKSALAGAEPLVVTRAPSTPGQATLMFAGDTALADLALTAIAAHGWLYPFGSTIDLVRGADVAIANHEAPISDGGTPSPLWKGWVYRAPAASARALADAGFDVLLLANNHMLDDGFDGLADTLDNAARAGLATIGAGRDEAEARRGVVVDVGGLRVGLLAYCERQLLWDVYVDQFARAHRAGVAMAAEPDLARDVARLRARADLVVVSFHVGENYEPPTRAARRWSERAIDAGADLVVDHHPHVAHPIAIYRGRPIVLSVGNYAFGTQGRFSGRAVADVLEVGLLAFAHARRCAGGGAAFDRLELVPMAVHNDRVRFRPEPLAGAELADTLARLGEASRRHGAELRDEGGRGVVTLPGCVTR
jgi:poly-gamma-glutamate synthesis protein (capsule biosynthesis protein)